MTDQKTLTLSNLSPNCGARHRRKRVGIGEGSGNGKTCGKGQKGQRARAGYKSKIGFEGGQMPIHRRLPKVGFTSRKRVLGENVYEVLNLEHLASVAEAGEIDIEMIRKLGYGRARGSKVKLLGGCSLDRALKIQVHAASSSAIASVCAAGGEVVILP